MFITLCALSDSGEQCELDIPLEVLEQTREGSILIADFGNIACGGEPVQVSYETLLRFRLSRQRGAVAMQGVIDTT